MLLTVYTVDHVAYLHRGCPAFAQAFCVCAGMLFTMLQSLIAPKLSIVRPINLCPCGVQLIEYMLVAPKFVDVLKSDTEQMLLLHKLWTDCVRHVYEGSARPGLAYSGVTHCIVCRSL